MSKAGRQLIEAAQEAVSVAKGDIPAARITVAGHSYVPEAEVVRLREAMVRRARAATGKPE